MQIRTLASKRHMLQPCVYSRTRARLTLRFAALCAGRAQQSASNSNKSLLSGNKREENLWRFCLPLNPIKAESHHCFGFFFTATSARQENNPKTTQQQNTMMFVQPLVYLFIQVRPVISSAAPFLHSHPAGLYLLCKLKSHSGGRSITLAGSVRTLKNQLHWH